MKPQSREMSSRLLAGSLLVAVSLLVTLCGRVGAQPVPGAAPPTTADVQIVSAELQRFAKPIGLDAKTQYDQALVLTLRADERQVDAFSPSLQPVVLIGRDEYRIFKEERTDRQILLTVHVQSWDRLQEGAPVILTVLQGNERNIDRLVRPNTPRYSRKLIVDKR